MSVIAKCDNCKWAREGYAIDIGLEAGDHELAWKNTHHVTVSEGDPNSWTPGVTWAIPHDR